MTQPSTTSATLSIPPQPPTTPTTSMSPPPSPSSPLIPNFPDDVALQIIARIPRSYSPDISLVCKSWRSILRSPLYFTIRSQLNCTQLFLYIHVRIRSSFKWFLLDPNHANPKALISLPPLPIQAIGSAFAILDSKIYVIGGSINEIPSSNVWVFDSRFNCWEPGPKMKVGREFGAAGVINNKIYVIGGCSIDNWTRSTHWAEVFDPKLGLWSPVPCPLENKEKWMHGSAVIDNKMYAMADRGGVAFDPQNSFWGYVSTELDLGWRGRAAVVDDILYCYDYLGRIRGFDSKEYIWRTLKGLEKDLPKFLCGATMANLGGKLCVVWEGHGSGRQIQVSCAVIEVRKDCYGDLWGSISWSQVFPEIPGHFSTGPTRLCDIVMQIMRKNLPSLEPVSSYSFIMTFFLSKAKSVHIFHSTDISKINLYPQTMLVLSSREFSVNQLVTNKLMRKSLPFY